MGQPAEANNIQIQTADFRPEYAGFWRRLAAGTVDVFVGGIISLAVSLALGTSLGKFGFFSSIFGFLFSVAYCLYFWVGNNGQTLGKRAAAVRVVREDGGRLDVKTALWRCAGYIVSAAALLGGFLGIFFDDQRQGWHDKIAGTIVVNTGDKPNIWLVAEIAALLFLMAAGGLAGVWFLYMVGLKAGL